MSDDGHWGWKPVEMREIGNGRVYPGYAMHSSPEPKNPEALCRWGMYKSTDFMVIIALNGRVFGYDRSGQLIKAKSRVERVVAAMGHQPVRLPATRRKKP